MKQKGVWTSALQKTPSCPWRVASSPAYPSRNTPETFQQHCQLSGFSCIQSTASLCWSSCIHSTQHCQSVLVFMHPQHTALPVCHGPNFVCPSHAQNTTTHNCCAARRCCGSLPLSWNGPLEMNTYSCEARHSTVKFALPSFD